MFLYQLLFITISRTGCLVLAVRLLRVALFCRELFLCRWEEKNVTLELKYQTQFFVCCKDANIYFCKDLKDIHNNWPFRRWNQVFHLVRTVSSNTSGFSIYLRIRITMSLGYQKWHLNLSWSFLEWAQVMWNVFERLSRLFLSRTYFLHSSDIYKVRFWLQTLERIAHVSSRSMRDPSLFITFVVRKGINTSV